MAATWAACVAAAWAIAVAVAWALATCAVAVRFSIDDGGGPDGTAVHGDRMEIFEALAELPDLWDINISDYSLEMGVSRFVGEGALENYMATVKSKTTKPVVTVDGLPVGDGRPGPRTMQLRTAYWDAHSDPKWVTLVSYG